MRSTPWDTEILGDRHFAEDVVKGTFIKEQRE